MWAPNMNSSLDRRAVGADKEENPSLNFLSPLEHIPEKSSSSNRRPTSYFGHGGEELSMLESQYENSLFSSSLSELFSRKLMLPLNKDLYGHSVGVVESNLEEEHFESLEQIQPLAIADLLPSDDDLFTGVNNRLHDINHDIEELDLFSSIGGMDLGDGLGLATKNDSEFHARVSNVQIGREQPYGEPPSRTLTVRNVNSNVEDSDLKALFQQYGDVCTLDTTSKHHGFVLISYYDIRAAMNAMKGLHHRSWMLKILDVHYATPKEKSLDHYVNHGILEFNIDSFVSNDELLQIFGVYGEIKEIHGIPNESHHKFIEFYDVRAADAAFHALNMKDIVEKQTILAASHPGDLNQCSLQRIPLKFDLGKNSLYVIQRSLVNNTSIGFSEAIPYEAAASTSIDNGVTFGLHSVAQTSFLEPSFHHGISSSIPANLPAVIGIESAGIQAGFVDPVQSQGQFQFDAGGKPNFPSLSLPEHHDGFNGVHCISPGTLTANKICQMPERFDNRQLSRLNLSGHSNDISSRVFGSPSSGSSSVTVHPFNWSCSYQPQSPDMIWPNSPSFINGISHSSPKLIGPRGPPSVLNSVMQIHNHNQHIGSAPTVNPCMWDCQLAYAGESPETSVFYPGSVGSMRISNSPLNSMELLPRGISPRMNQNCLDFSLPSRSMGIQSQLQRPTMFPCRGQLVPMIASFDPPNGRARNRRNEGGTVNQTDKKQYELDIDRILHGEDSRTTLMIKNIPNKYTSKMLLAAIDEHHRGNYDFVYLPIDFKNKCNVGYAFINLINPQKIISFYQAFNGKKWEKFNSEKVASLAYARIQGKAALIAHFQNSSLMNEDKRCRPILFNTDGPNAGDQMPFPVGANVRTRPGKARMLLRGHDEIESPRGNSACTNGEDSSSGDVSSGSGRESD